MSTAAQAKILQFFHRLKYLIVAVLVIWLLMFLTSDKFGAVIDGLTPPTMPDAPQGLKQTWLAQNWSKTVTDKYHHVSQGTATVPIPLEWFLALEQASDSPWWLWIGKDGRFADQQYLSRMGFIRSEASEHNPHNLPVGFATTDFINYLGVKTQKTGLGFNCAACHTGHLTYGDTEYVIEGGPATVNLGYFTKAIGAALGQTAVSANIPVFNGRFERFAKNVLGEQYEDGNKLALKDELEAVVAALAALPSEVKVEEGAARLDALNRIGNKVFSVNLGRDENYVPIDAPVNFPHIWTASWFNWVQYDGSIMQPLARNAGEALGVAANINTTADKNRFSSSIPMKNLKWIEDQLGGVMQPTEQNGFGGLWSPPWPDAFGKPDPQLVSQGKSLYQSLCQHCHLPALNSEEIWDQQKHYFANIVWYENGDKKTSPEKVLQLNLVPIDVVGTDPAQANILLKRTVNTANTLSPQYQGSNAMGIDTDVCGVMPLPLKPTQTEQSYQTATKENDDSTAEKHPMGGDLINVPVSDNPMLSFALGLGAVVQQTQDAWFNLNYISEADRFIYEGERPNCLRAGNAYKERPLNGVWATAPFLHNGSIATLTDLLTPADERPRFIQLGNTEFDVNNVGVTQIANLPMKAGQPYEDGWFIVDTQIPGNLNTGHEFSDDYNPSKQWNEQPKGVIGPKLSEQERKAIIEYLKTL